MGFTDIWSYFFSDPMAELYRFSCGPSLWTRTPTSRQAIVFDGMTYEPAFIQRTALHYSSDFAKDVLTVTLSADDPLAQVFMAGTPEFLMRLAIFRGNRHAGNYQQVWTGLVTGASFSFSSSDHVCELTCETAASRMERMGLSRNYQLTCPHALYGSKCGVDMASRAGYDTVASISGFAVTLSGSGYPDGYFTAGQMVTASGARRFISSQAGSVFTLERSMPLSVGDAVTIYPGCDKAWATCTGKFGNGVNFGGFPWLPVTNPYTSDIG